MWVMQAEFDNEPIYIVRELNLHGEPEITVQAGEYVLARKILNCLNSTAEEGE